MNFNVEALINKLTGNYAQAQYGALTDKTGLYVIQG